MIMITMSSLQKFTNARLLIECDSWGPVVTTTFPALAKSGKCTLKSFAKRELKIETAFFWSPA
eukprot:CAMPEP_0196594644 /NCGR_PEP_ID=MMETSP1081-20130531/78906_1 /TAXON_ID=36882 /ORGANISM="Pyramimonas amylifera, Strain CCMP720" /LENGTH=62 /DNA_ID=CAMNT_0041918961 /DNA_START=84 /DNA_END=269 /DNA_ORIENTATION=+